MNSTHNLNIGGLVGLGFDSSGEFMLTVSHSGRGVYSTRTWERVSRDPRTVYPENGYSVGIGPIDGEMIPITEKNYDTEELQIATSDGRFELRYFEGIVEVREL